MPNICYYFSKAGEEMARWPGTTVRTERGPRKKGQISLGKVISKEKLIFYKTGEGYYHFDPTDQSTHDIAVEDLPSHLNPPDYRLRDPPVIVSFGADYFLDRFLHGIEYMPVIDSLVYGNPDRLHSMLHYYTLSNRANCHAEIWYRHSYAKYLFPNANISSQRISEFLKAIGSPENRRVFLDAHIDYLKNGTDQAKCVIIDSTGCPNKCSLYVTRWSVHGSEENLEFRVIAVVHKYTGLPLYYEVINGNVVDIKTVTRVKDTMAEFGFDVDYVLGDAGYCCPAVMERMIWEGMDFMTRLSPNFTLYKKVVKEHLKELTEEGILVNYHGRRVRVLKIREVVAHDRETKAPVEGYVYLCLDIQAHCSKIDHLISSEKSSKMTGEEFMAACEKLGLFAIVTTRDLSPQEVLAEYYIRQGVEQFFDFAKNYGRFLPVRCHCMETLQGHMLLAFIATFVICLIEYRLNLVDTRYVALSDTMNQAAITLPDGTMTIDVGDAEQETVIEQDILEDIFRGSAGELFYDLRLQMADVYKSKIIPELIAESSSLYGAYELHTPRYIEIGNGKPVSVLRDGDIDNCTKILAFARKPTLTDEEIEAQRDAKQQRKLEKAAAKQGFKLTAIDSDASASGDGSQAAPAVHRGRGRPKGSKNKKTLERERQAAAAATASQADAGIGEAETPVHRGRGRPKGSKNKKTLERERQAAAAASQADAGIGDVETAETTEAPVHRGRGRPKGSKNKKTLERERQAAAAATASQADAGIDEATAVDAASQA